MQTFTASEAKQSFAAVLQTCVREPVLIRRQKQDELVQVLWRPKFDRYLSADDRHRFLALLAGVTRRVHITRQFHLCRDARDSPFLDVAFSGQANAIVTGVQDLLVLRAFEGVPNVSPADFLAV